MSVTTCLLNHMGAKSPIAAYRKEMAEDVAELVADGMTTEAAWLKVAGDKLAELKAERTRIEQVVADAYAKTPAGAEQPATEEPTQALEPVAESADTETKESTNDPAPEGNPPAVDQPMDAGVVGPDGQAQPTRGASQPRRKPGRADDRGVREQGGLFEGVDDEGGDVGDGAGPAAVSDGSDDAVAGGDGRVHARDFRPAPGGLTREGSWFDTAKRNLDLIDLARTIESEKRDATPEEQAQLSKYVGFGAGEIRNNIFPVPSQWEKAQAKPGTLIYTESVRDARWKALAERAAALPEEWQRTILQSTQYAHYTSENIIRSMWSAVQRLGFTGGKVFEPGGGIGSFAMLMPETVRKTSRYTAIEFDGPTALIAKLLSPQQNMLHDDFIKRKLPDDFFDAAMGNPPFSQTPVLADPRYEKKKFMLHDFFFAKSIDKVRPGGLLAFVTSKGTMDKQTDKARKYLMERADLIGAIRLPSTAFEGNAGTSVVTDVIFLRKRAPGEAPAGMQWANVKTVDTKDGPVIINEYFADHPEMVLGQNRISGNTDDQGRRINSNGYGGEKYTVVSYDTAEELDAKFAAAVERLPANVYSAQQQNPKTLVREVAKMDFDPKIKREGVIYVGKGGDLLRVEQGVGKALGEVVKLSDKDTAWLKSYVGVRDLVQEARYAQVTDGDWQGALKKLNKAYDAFVKQHGPINAFRLQVRRSTDEDGNAVETTTRVFTNRRLFREDYDAAIMTQLETIDEEGNVKKAAFLRERTIGKPVTREIKTIGDALAVSLDETGRLNLDDVAQRLRISRAEAIEALGNQVYRTPQGEWQLADEYLSGNVVAKLAEAIEAARLDDKLRRNVDALKEVQPEKLGPSQISVKLGAAWVKPEHVQAFAKEIEAGAVSFDPKTESWQVEGGNMRSERRAGAEWGTAARSPSELLEAVLNSRQIKVMTKVDKKDVVDSEATTAANEMAKKIKQKFKSWVWTDTDRAADLVEAYNDRFNNIAPRRFDGSHLTLPGVSLRYKLHAHQLRAIWRQIQTGNTYLAHAVGSGKTIEMIAGGMEQKRLGLIKKPIYVVPNHMLEQFSNEFMELYPLANIMVADDQNFSKERRKAFVAAATLNAPDAVIITHSAFERIGVKEESVAPIRDEILSDLEDEMAEVAKDKGARVRRGQLEQQIEAVTQRFDSIVGAGSKDALVTFEEMGVDYIYVDEAHTYRKLDFHTAQSIKGIDPNGSRRALDMYVKTRWLEKQRPGRAMTFATGTPVTNTMGELFTIMRFFSPQVLEEGGITTFDSWARMFGEVGAALEPNAAGKYEVVERFSKFDNVPELMSRVRQFMDVLQSDQLGAVVKRPDVEGGKPDLIVVPATEAMKRYQEKVLQPRLEESRKWKPSKDEPNNPDPVIAIITDGRFAATDPRFTGGKVLPGESTKINTAAEQIAAEYKATAKNVYNDRDGKPLAAKGGTQIVFYNVGFGASAAASRGFNSRAAFTKALVDGGVKREHIVWFDDADTDAKKEAIFKGMRNGAFRVLIGSAKKMGTGVNVQNRLTALHYMDPPWFPADVEQPHGRIIRQGNQNPLVRIKWYATKGGYDSTMWQMVGRKQRFIDQAFSGDKSLRTMEDMGEASLYEQAAALASGDPRAMKLAGLKQDVERLERQQAAHANEQLAARRALEHARWEAESYEKRQATYEKALKAIGGGYFQFSTGEIGGKAYAKQTDFGQALKDAFNRGAADHALDPDMKPKKLGSMGSGIELSMHPSFTYKEVKDDTGKHSVKVPSGEHELVVEAGGYGMSIGSAVAAFGADVDALGLARKVVNALNGVDGQLRQAKAKITDVATDMNRLRKKIGAPFEHQQEMLEKYAELKALEEELRLEGLAPAAEPGAAEAAPAATNLAQTGAPEANESDVLFSLADRVDAMRNGTKLDASGLDRGRAEPDTSAYEPAGNADTAAVDRLAASLNRGQPRERHVVLDAVAARAGATGPRARELAAVGAAAKRLFGHRVVFVKFQGAPLFNGAVDEQSPGVIFINANAQRPMMAVLGHELLHQLSASSPDLYREFVRRIGRVTKNAPDYAARIEAQYKSHGREMPKEWVEELHADIVGDNFTDPQFWRDMAADQPGLFKRLANAILKFLDDVAESLRGARSFGTERYLTDIDAARAAVVSAMRQFSENQTEPMADTVEGIRLSAADRTDQTETPAFRKWFGDSKVVDADGKPLVVYHGTDAGDFSEFAPGSFFTTDPREAGAYAGTADLRIRARAEGKYTLASGKELAGTEVPYHGTLSDIHAPKAGDVFATDNGVFRSRGGGKWEALTDLVVDYGSGDGDMLRIVRGDGVEAREHVQEYEMFVKETYPRGDGGRVLPAYLSLQNPVRLPAMEANRLGIRLGASRESISAAIEKYSKQGYDGIVTDSDEATMFPELAEAIGDVPTQYIAFRPEQIKSAIGNRGTFDAGNPDIRLSIADTLQEHVERVRGIDQQKVRNAFADMVGNAGAKVSWWDKHLGTQYAKAEKFPAYKRVFERVQSYIEDVSTLANEAADQAPLILPKLETWKDLKKSFQQFGLKKADAEAVAAPIFKGTLTDQKVYSDDELRADFGLKPEQIKAYRQFRNAVDTSLDHVVAADVLRLLGDDATPRLRALALADREQLRTGIHAYLEAKIEALPPGNERTRLRQLQKDIFDKYARVAKLKAEGYAPLMRFGQYKVYVSDPDTGESLFFGLYESKAEANRMARDLAEDPQFAGKSIEQGVLSQEQYKLFNSVPVESLEMFADAIGAEKSEVFQAYLRLAKNNRSALKRLIHRKGTAGFSEDVPRVLASFITSNSRLASGAMNLTSAKEEIESIRDGDVKDEAIRLVESVQSPKETAAAARSLMFMNFIGGSVASAVVNLTQPVTMTLPYLSQFGGLAKASARLMAAGKMAATGRVDDPELRAALKRAEDDGTVSPQEIHHLTAQAMGSWGNNAVSKRAAFIWGAPFSLAEQFNRRTSFIAAYKTAQAEGIADPFAFAEKAVTETQGLYNKGNMPNLSRGAIGATAMQFKQFSIHYLEWMQRMWNAGEPGSDQRRAGRRAVLIALALLMLAAGTDGLPFAEDIDDLVDTIGQALGYNTNAKKARRDLIANTLGLGDETADAVARGLSAIPGVPMDVSLRMGMGNLIPGSGLLLRSNTDRSRDLLEFAGPAGGMAKQYMDAAQKGLGGDVGGMLSGVVPVAAQNAMKALDMWQTGEARDTMGRKVMEADEVDGLMKFLGFNPANIARESQKMGMIRRSEQLAKNVEGEIAGKWARAFAEGDAAGVAEARAELAEWNQANPEERIAITSAQILQRVKKMRQSREQRFITSASPERRRGVEEALQ